MSNAIPSRAESWEHTSFPKEGRAIGGWLAWITIGAVLTTVGSVNTGTLAAPAAPAAPARLESEKLPEGAKVMALEAFPKAVELDSRFAYRQVLLTARLQNGDRIDVTRMAKFETASDCVAVEADGRVHAQKDGSGELRFSLAGQKVAIPVRVQGYSAPYTTSFVQDVMPVMSRLGCNSGTCHGSQKGKNGFKLSLRGNDPLFDHRALTDDLAGRRFNRAFPERSLFLLKVGGVVPHVGGVLTGRGQRYFELFRTWVAAGVKLDLEAPRVEKIEVLPKNPVLPLSGMTQRMVVLATYTDGKVRDVTAEAFIETSDTETTQVEKGLVTALRRGEAAILARYEGRYDATQLFIMGDRRGFEWKETPEYNFVDTLVYKKLKTVKTLPSDVCTDADFLRRIYLDLTGLPPSPRETTTFLLDRRESRIKRAEVVDRLIGNAEFVEFWTNKWSDLLQVNRKFLGVRGAKVLREWVQGAVASNMPYNSFVASVLNTSGSTIKNPPAAYYKVLRQPEAAMENTTQLFLGVRFNCNKCHDHPFEKWTQRNYWELASYFAQVGRKKAAGAQGKGANMEEEIFDMEKGEVSSPLAGPIQVSFPYQHGGGAAQGSRRAQLTAWLTSAKNPYFAKSYVNRIWSYFLGIGLIDPVDDIRAGNPPSNPELLDRLTREFVDSGFDTRKLMRIICNSRVYQHSIRTNKWNADDKINFSHAMARRLPAETLFDAIHRATGSRPKLPGVRPGTRAASLIDPAVKLGDGFLDLFGRPARESACECERSTGMSLGQALNLVNGPTVAEAIRDPNNLIAELVSNEKNSRAVARELFLSVLCRPPTDAELADTVKILDHNDLGAADSLTPETAKVLAERLAAFEKRQVIPEWKMMQPEIVGSAGGATLAREKDGSIFVSGAKPDTDTYTLVTLTNQEAITGLRLEVLADKRLPKNGPGRADNGNLVLTHIKVFAAPASDPTQVKPVALQNPTATFAQKDHQIQKTLDPNPKNGWAISPQLGRNHRAVFEFKENVGMKGGTLLTVVLEHKHPKHAIGKFRLALTSTKRPIRLINIPADLVAAIKTPAAKRTVEQRAVIYRHYIRTDAEMINLVRLNSAQDLAWALINSPAFLFNR